MTKAWVLCILMLDCGGRETSSNTGLVGGAAGTSTHVDASSWDVQTDADVFAGSDASVMAECPFMAALAAPDPRKFCNTDSDCVLRFLPDCCAGALVIGLAKGAECSWTNYWCDSPYSCPPGPPTFETDDGRPAASRFGIIVRCGGGSCLSYGPDCAGQPCPDGNVCVTIPCPIAGTDIPRTCSPIPPGCAAGSDTSCAASLCQLNGGFADGSFWKTPRDLQCGNPCLL
jgi:hypothetical protein